MQNSMRTAVKRRETAPVGAKSKAGQRAKSADIRQERQPRRTEPILYLTDPIRLLTSGSEACTPRTSRAKGALIETPVFNASSITIVAPFSGTSPESYAVAQSLASILSEVELHPETRAAHIRRAAGLFGHYKRLAVNDPFRCHNTASAYYSIIKADHKAAFHHGFAALEASSSRPVSERAQAQRMAWNALSSAALRCGQFRIARDYAGKAFDLSPTLRALASLVECDLALGVSSSAQREWIAILLQREPQLMARLRATPNSPLAHANPGLFCSSGVRSRVRSRSD